jgi:hypothetical protein
MAEGLVTTSQDVPALKNGEVPRSNFVTVLAWILIVGSGFVTFISLMQAVMLAFFFPTEQFSLNSGPPHGIENAPPLMEFLISKVLYLFLAFWLLALLTLVSSIGLLRRKNWARLILVGIFGLGILWNLGSIWLQWQMFSAFPQFSLKTQPDQFTQQMESMFAVMRVGTTIFALAVAVLFAWLVKRLVSLPIRNEFGAL